jgi:hypothetical protein
MILTRDRSTGAVNVASSLVASTRGGSSVGQSSGLIIRRSQVQVLPAPPIYQGKRDDVDAPARRLATRWPQPNEQAHGRPMSAARQDFIAECQSCGRPFVMGQAGSTGTQIGTTGEMYVEELVFHGDQIAMKGVQGRCPHCGGMGQIPDGVYGLVANGYTVLSALTLPDVQRLASLLRRFTEEDAVTDEDILAAVPDEVRELVRSALATSRWQFVVNILLAIALFTGYRDPRPHDASTGSFRSPS